jgi:hypothetical protein
MNRLKLNWKLLAYLPAIIIVFTIGFLSSTTLNKRRVDSYGYLYFKYYDSVMVHKNFKIVNVINGAVSDSLITRHANGNITRLNMNQLIVPYANITGRPLSTTDLSEGTNLYFTTARARSSISSGNELSYNSSTGVVSKTKNTETSTGTTNASGTYTFTFAKTYSVAPNVQANIINGTDSQIIRVGTPTTTSVTVTVRNRTDVVGLLPSWSNVNGANVHILVNEF